MAAFALCSQLGVQAQPFCAALDCFEKPPHRIEWVREVGGVTFIDDSKATSVDATIKAVQSLSNPVILIVGGLDKGGSYFPWITVFKNKVKNILAIGQAAQIIKAELDAYINVAIHNDLEQAVHAALQCSLPGDTILLSPGCSSLDMFEDYMHRGREFKKIVFQI